MKEHLEKIKDRATDFSGSKSRKTAKGIIGAVVVILLGALGLELFGTDIDLGNLLDSGSVSESVIERDEAGNLERTEEGSFATRVRRDQEGNVIADGEAGGKFTDEYNCDDFSTQPEAQTFFTNAGGPSSDTNRLDGDNDGEACESLPKGSGGSE